MFDISFCSVLGSKWEKISAGMVAVPYFLSST